MLNYLDQSKHIEVVIVINEENTPLITYWDTNKIAMENNYGYYCFMDDINQSRNWRKSIIINDELLNLDLTRQYMGGTFGVHETSLLSNYNNYLQ